MAPALPTSHPLHLPKQPPTKTHLQTAPLRPLFSHHQRHPNQQSLKLLNHPQQHPIPENNHKLLQLILNLEVKLKSLSRGEYIIAGNAMRGEAGGVWEGFGVGGGAGKECGSEEEESGVYRWEQ
jgi:hypothetical protein